MRISCALVFLLTAYYTKKTTREQLAPLDFFDLIYMENNPNCANV